MKRTRIQLDLDPQAIAQKAIEAHVTALLTPELIERVAIKRAGLFTAREAAKFLRIGINQFYALQLPKTQFGINGRWSLATLQKEISVRTQRP